MFKNNLLKYFAGIFCIIVFGYVYIFIKRLLQINNLDIWGDKTSIFLFILFFLPTVNLCGFFVFDLFVNKKKNLTILSFVFGYTGGIISLILFVIMMDFIHPSQIVSTILTILISNTINFISYNFGIIIKNKKYKDIRIISLKQE
jgi:hypothetical protein